MSAKPGKKRANQPANTPAPQPAAAASGAGAAVVSAEPPEQVAWIDSPDPKKRMWGKIVLAGVWIYVAALCLLAIDQWFNLGIFSPKLPPLP